MNATSGMFVAAGFIIYLIISVLALVVALEILIGIFVYRDAKRRGMNAALWTAVAVLVPSLIGVIVYLLARGNMPDGKLCASCGAQVLDEYAACPECGSELAAPCPGCGKRVSKEWAMCPYCTAKLPEPRKVYKTAGKSFPALAIAIIVLVVLVFAGLMLLVYSPMYGLTIDFQSFSKYTAGILP